MKLTITTQVDTNVGIPVTGLVGTLIANTSNLLTTGTVACTLEFYANDNAKLKGMNTCFPVILKEDGTISKIVASCTITLTQQEVLAANLPGTIYTKTAAKLAADYSWTVIAS